MAKQEVKIPDPCGSFGPTQWWAVVWFLAVMIIGSKLTIFLAKSDHWMYEHNGEFLDYRAYHENRRATTSLGVEQVDERAHADYVSTMNYLRPQQGR